MVLMSEERSVKKEFMVMIMFFLFTLMLYRPIAFQFANNLRNYYCLVRVLKFSGGSEVKTSACNDGDPGSNPGSGRSTGEGNGNPLQYSSLENPMERGAW